MKKYQPFVEFRESQPYASIRKQVMMNKIPEDIPPLIDILSKRLQELNVEITGEPFFRYWEYIEKGQIVVEAGLPVSATLTEFDDITWDAFPAGNYLGLTHQGSYDKLGEVHMFLEKYSKENNLALDDQKTPTGVKWGCRAELYITDPLETPDVNDWLTEVIFLLK